ncbi:MAG: 4-hydroxy-tetrahydrodipicolinate synthase [Paludibacteraceae bacterium]|nr:4-hydroxy-tetrahydrodipicolinate synthase [Paludibacteraceae bacterium]
MKMLQLNGLGTALITPFLPNGAVDYDGLRRLLDIQLKGGVDYIVVLGTTGESATMTEQERKEVRQFIVRYIAGRMPLVLGLGGNNTAALVEELQTNKDELQRDFVAILSVCPFYNKPSQDGLYQHFTAVAEHSPLPVILYNVPGRTGVNLLPETVMRIFEAMPEKIMGIKEASGNIEQIKHLIDLTKNQPVAGGRFLLVISGDDGIAADVMMAGGAGLISVAANAWPKEYGQIVRKQDIQLQNRFANMVHLLFKEGNPSGIKTVLSEMGVIHNVLRLPLVPNSMAVQDEIRSYLNNY